MLPASLRLLASRVLLIGIAFFHTGIHEAFAAEEIVIRSGPQRVSLLELYTSEGCSSCPPAERWLSGFRTDPRLWQSVVPIAFHVDYWDGLGWKDPFARAEWTARQRAYSAAWKTASVYTPGFVVDGREWRGWLERSPLPTSGDRVGTLEARASGDTVAVRFEPTAKFAGGTAHLAWLGLDLVSEVRRGENSGRALRHDFVVLRHGSAALAASASAWTARLEVDRPARSVGALVVWIEVNGAPLQATGGLVPTK